MKVRVLVITGLALLAASPAWAQSTVADSGAKSNEATQAVTAPAVSTQNTALIAGAAGTAISGALGGGFSPGGGGTGGFGAPAGGGGGAPGAPGAPGSGTTSSLKHEYQVGGLNSRQMGQAGANGGPKMGVWAQGSVVSIDKSEVALQMDGTAYSLMGGIDYKFNDRGVVGLAFGYETVDMDLKFNNGTYQSDGYTIAPYFGYAINQNWSVDATLGYSWLENETTRNRNAVRGSFDGTRWFGAANVTGNYAVNRWRLSPKVGVLYLEETSDAYNERGTSTARIAENTVKFGRLSAGLKTGYAFSNWMPFAKLTGEYDFEKPGAVLKSNGRMSNVDDGGLVYGVGVDFFSGNVSGTVEGSYNSGLRQDLDVWQGTARVRIQF